jgi:hypothetical protein
VFERIVADGTGLEFEPEHNKHWLEVTRPQLEAFFHDRFMVEMAVKYGEELEERPAILPSGSAALLSLRDFGKSRAPWTPPRPGRALREQVRVSVEALLQRLWAVARQALHVVCEHVERAVRDRHI